jgi:N,N'-diacetylbacillosaminyl-diphospho-undecaprenol alpha-1,3-N-acetylgalactosaminyltransferase
MGSMFTEGTGLKRKVLRLVVMGLYAMAFRFIERVQFLNRDDMLFFVSHRIISPHKAVLVRSSGVNLTKFDAAGVEPRTLERLRAELGIDAQTRVVAMVARAYWSKGVREFVTAAEALRPHHNVVCMLAGAAEDGPDAVPAAYLREHESPGFRWLGFRRDVRELMALADVVVLPSYYPEGVPKSMLEAMALSKPIVTTDNRGCREVIEDGKNGFMIPIKDAEALTAALDTLLRDPEMRAAFGANSRQKAAREFDEAVVVGQVLRQLYQLDKVREPDTVLVHR